MKLFLDTANIDEIRRANNMGVISGVTTNPSLMAKALNEKQLSPTSEPLMNGFDIIKEIVSIVDGPISVEINPKYTHPNDMVKEARMWALANENIVIKIPMCEAGLVACKTLSKEGINVNMTLIFSPNQALLAALAGAKYVSPFIGRLDDIDFDGIDLIKEISDIFANYSFDCEIIAASVRNQLHVTKCALVGADIATVPYKVLTQMIDHPLTTAGIEKFKKDAGV